MTLLIIGLALWWVVHLFPIFAAPRRDVLVARFGEMPYKAVYALLTIATVAVMAKGYQQAPVVNLWFPPTALVHPVTFLVMPLAVAVFIAGRIPSPVRGWIRHPQFTGVKIWALAHILVNGDLASLVLFGGLLAWAVVAMIGTNRRDGPRGEKPLVTKAGTPIHVLATFAVYYLIVMVHSWAGVSPLPV